MSTKTVVVDAGQLTKGVEFPPLKMPKYDWEEYPGLDQAAALEQGVELLAFPDADCSDVGDAQELCYRMVQAIEHYVASGVADEETV